MGTHASFTWRGASLTPVVEGHWRQAKKSMPTFGTRKHLFASYLGELMRKHERKGEDLFQEIIKVISNTKYDGKDWGQSGLMTYEKNVKESYYILHR